MSAGKSQRKPAARLPALLLWAWIASHASAGFAIDNPDTPDLVGEFEARAEKLEARFQEQASNTAEFTLAFSAYEKFLDQELNKAYEDLARRLDAPARQDLRSAQKRWLQYRDAEFRFIAGNWTQENFGSSSAISRGALRAAVVKDRVVGLLHYLKNYGPAAK